MPAAAAVPALVRLFLALRPVIAAPQTSECVAFEELQIAMFSTEETWVDCKRDGFHVPAVSDCCQGWLLTMSKAYMQKNHDSGLRCVNLVSYG